MRYLATPPGSSLAFRNKILPESLLFQVGSREPITGGDSSPQSAPADQPTTTKPICKAMVVMVAETKRNHRRTRGANGPKSQKRERLNTRPLTGVGPRGAEKWKNKSAVNFCNWETLGKNENCSRLPFFSLYYFISKISLTSFCLENLLWITMLITFRQQSFRQNCTEISFNVPSASASYYARIGLYTRQNYQMLSLTSSLIFLLSSLTLIAD
jgi:hypothetical protein